MPMHICYLCLCRYHFEVVAYGSAHLRGRKDGLLNSPGERGRSRRRRPRVSGVPNERRLGGGVTLTSMEESEVAPSPRGGGLRQRCGRGARGSATPGRQKIEERGSVRRCSSARAKEQVRLPLGPSFARRLFPQPSDEGGGGARPSRHYCRPSRRPTRWPCARLNALFLPL